MVPRSSLPPRLLLVVGDILLNLLAFHLAGSFYLARSGGAQASPGLDSLWLLYPIVALCWVVASLIIPVYDPKRTHHARVQLPLVAGAAGLTSLLLVGLAFFVFRDLPRFLVVYFLVLDLVFVLAFRIVLFWLWRLLPEGRSEGSSPSLTASLAQGGSQVASSFKAADLVAVLALALGLFWLVFIRSFGLGFTPDSVQYMTYALKMHYASTFGNTPFWPPMYPILINLSMFANGFPAEAAALLSGISMVLFLAVFALVLRNYSQDLVLIGLLLLTLFTLNVFLHSFRFALSEATFSLFLLLNFFFVIKHYQTKRLRYYVFAALFASCAALTRYIGYSLIAVFFAYTLYFLYVNRRDERVSAGKYLLLNSISYVPSVLYLIRNYAIWQTFHGPRVNPYRTFFYNLEQAFKVIGKELNLYLLGLLVVALVLFILLLKSGASDEKNRYVLPLVYIIGFVGLYMALLLYATSQTAVVKIGTRYFSPVYFFLFLFVFISFQGALRIRIENKQLEGVYRSVLQVTLYGLALAALIGQIRYFGEFLDGIARKQHETASHVDAGYDSSLTSIEFQRFFRDLVADRDALYVSVLAFQGPHRASSFLFREALLDDTAYTGFSFDDIRSTFPFWEGDVLQGTDFTVSFKANGQEKSIFYRDLPPLENDEQLINALRNILTEEDDIDSLWLIVYENEELLTVGRNVAEVLPEDLQIRFQQDIAPYAVYEFALLR